MVLTEKKTETQTADVVLEKPANKSYFGSISVETEENPLFEVEKEYNNFEIPEQKSRSKMLPEFDILPAKNAKVNAKQDAQITKDIKLSLRGKILAVVTSLVTVLLLTLVIYNAVVLGAKRAEINALSVQLAASVGELEALETELTSAQSEEEISRLLRESGSTLRKATSADKVKVAIESYSVESYNAPTNWFDKICEFLSNLFG